MTDSIYRQVRSLIINGRHCVMATARDNRPYCSLMAYVAEPGGTAVYMVTHRQTKKFGNLAANPAVSLLIDTRETERPRALTLEGTFSEVVDASERRRIRSLFLARHPRMRAFVEHADAAFIRIDLHRALLLDGLTEAHYLDFSREATEEP